jgi:hypothetical protein
LSRRKSLLSQLPYRVLLSRSCKCNIKSQMRNQHHRLRCRLRHLVRGKATLYRDSRIKRIPDFAYRQPIATTLIRTDTHTSVVTGNSNDLPGRHVLSLQDPNTRNRLSTLPRRCHLGTAQGETIGSISKCVFSNISQRSCLFPRR